jgi:hypothetical protein
VPLAPYTAALPVVEALVEDPAAFRLRDGSPDRAAALFSKRGPGRRPVVLARLLLYASGLGSAPGPTPR